MFITDRISGKRVQIHFERTDRSGRYSPLRTPQRRWVTWDAAAYFAVFLMACAMGALLAFGI